MRFSFSILAVLFIQLTAIQTAFSSHIMGADITHVYLGNSTYKIVARIYRECNGIPLINPTGKTFSGNDLNASCGSSNLQFNLVSITDITQVCGTKPCNPKNTQSFSGVEEHIYECTADLSQNPYAGFLAKGCCELSFAIGQCCRSGAITTSPGGDFYVLTTLNICNLNKCKNKYNNCAAFVNPVQPIVCVNSPVQNILGAIDTADFDSVNYALTPAITFVPNPTFLSYNSPYSAKYPMKPYCIPTSSVSCTPQPDLFIPKGFYLDTVAGNYRYLPTKGDEIGILNAQTNEYRKDSTGNWVLIATTQRDVQEIVKSDCDMNNIPLIQGKSYVSVCAGTSVLETFTILDSNSVTVQDSISFDWFSTVPGIHVDTVKRNAHSYQLIINVTNKNTEGFYNLVINATDNRCNRKIISRKNIVFHLRGKQKQKINFSNLECNKFTITTTGAYTANTAKSNWTILDSTKKQLFKSIRFSDTFTIGHGGKFYLINHFKDAYCFIDSLQDSISMLYDTLYSVSHKAKNEYQQKWDSIDISGLFTLTDSFQHSKNPNAGFTIIRYNNNSVIPSSAKIVSQKYFLQSADSGTYTIRYSQDLTCNSLRDFLQLKLLFNPSLGFKTIEETNFKLFPNPTINGIITISYPITKNIGVQLLDVAGRCVWKADINTNQATVLPSTLHSGFYFLKIATAQIQPEICFKIRYEIGPY